MHSLARLALLAPLAQAAVRRFTTNETTSVAVSSDIVSSVSSVVVSETLEAEAKMRLLGPDPILPADPSSSPYCTWWYDNHGGIECEDMPAFWDITVAEWHRWNPSVAQSCANFVVGRSYCVEAFGHPGGDPAPTPTTSTTTTTTAVPPTTTTAPSNGIETPQPIQPGMVGNCNKFHLVTSGQTCAVIASANGISVAQFLSFNTEINSACSNIWLDAYVCVSIIGLAPPSPTTTAPGNGIATPQPTQPGMVNNCNRFHLVESGNTCATITSRYGISLAQFLSWNTELGSTCGGLWLDAWVCISVIGHNPQPPTPTTTAPGNGIATPQPTQPGMVSNCNRFHLVESGNTCATITSRYGISLTQFSNWNRELGSACSGLWLDAWVCIGIIGFTPTPTNPGNGIQTPSPIQTGMTPNCRRFHFVADGQTCQTIASQYSITLAQFTRWNTAVGNDCRGLWAQTWACVQGP